MIFRTAVPDDIPQIQIVRNSVRENMLSNPGLVSDADCLDYLTRRGKGWVCIADNVVVGFAIADLVEENIWALFIHPLFEGRGIGKELHRLMLDWYFDQGKNYVWLGTAPDTRAEKFYRALGWQENGSNGSKEIKFELTPERYMLTKSCK